MYFPGVFFADYFERKKIKISNEMNKCRGNFDMES